MGKEEIACCNFFFSHNVFKSCLLLMRQNEYLWSKRLTDKKRLELIRSITIAGKGQEWIILLVVQPTST